LRYIPAAVASTLVDAEHAIIDSRNGKIRSIRLIQTAENSSQRVGAPQPLSPVSYGTRFIVRERLDTGDVVWAFARRSFEPPE
jgi:hypothetical protein